VEDLLNSVRIKWIATTIGLEKIVLKKGKLIGYFISDQQSAFFQSAEFSKVLSYVQQHKETCRLKEKQTRNGLRLLLIFDHIKSVHKALEVLQPMAKKPELAS
jgi:transcription-repair coupling factor (superfamily II helicase)